MAALAYLLPPLSGLIAYGLGSTERIRWHGLQSVVFGAAWPAAMYLGSAAGPLGTRIAFGVGLLVWLGFLIGAGIGFNPRLPGGRRLRSLAGYGGEEGAPEEAARRSPSG